MVAITFTKTFGGVTVKKNEAKAVLFLGQYSQNKGLLNETVKMLDFLEDLNKNK